MTLVILVILGLWIVLAIKNYLYKQSDYYKNTGRELADVFSDDGISGEYRIYRELSIYEETGAKFLYNCYIPAGYGKTTEIDIIMLHSSGVYVIESKNYSGWIFGSEDKKNWTQTLPGRGELHKEHFFNPVMQNRNHVKHLRRLIGEDVTIYSIVVFSEDCEFKDVKITGGDTVVIQLYDLRNTVFNYSNKSMNSLTPDMINDFYVKLSTYTNVSNDVKEKHINDIRRTTNMGYNGLANEGKCPWCGRELVLREAKRGSNVGGKFYGCSGFPKCRYTRNLK